MLPCPLAAAGDISTPLVPLNRAEGNSMDGKSDWKKFAGDGLSDEKGMCGVGSADDADDQPPNDVTFSAPWRE